MSKYESGQVIEVGNYPFVREVFNGVDFDGENFHEFQHEGWRPGCDVESDDSMYGRFYCADGIGSMILTVVSTHKPGNFPERVFFTRHWRDPDGKEFGKKTKLRVIAVSSFTALTRGYRHRFEVVA